MAMTPAGLPTRPSEAFARMVDDMKDNIGNSHPDLSVRYVMKNVPIFPAIVPTPQQAKAAGCEKCTFLGLWANSWPGYPASKHGDIWVFEDGVVKQAKNKGIPVQAQVEDTLIHEAQHALGRDHVLEAMHHASPLVAALYAQPIPPSAPMGYVTPRGGIRRTFTGLT